jgi:excisionase family DNA binding protein
MQAMASKTSAEPWVSFDAVAAHLGVAKDSVYRGTDAKGLPGHRFGRLSGLKLSEIDEWGPADGAGQTSTSVKPARGTTKTKKK